MHEMAVARALEREVRSAMPAGARLLRVRLEVGMLEHLDEVVFEAAWNARTERTALTGSQVDIHRVPLLVHCKACGCDYEPEEPALLMCPCCGLARPLIRKGSGIVMTALDIRPLRLAAVPQEV